VPGEETRIMLDPQVQAVIDRTLAAGQPPLYTLSPPEARAAYRAARLPLQPAPAPVAAVEDRDIPGPHGPIGLRLYRPQGTEAKARLPALVYIHGGGFVIGDRDTHDVVCRALANEARCRVVSVDYHLAPEHKFPAAVEDCIAATAWVAREAAALGIDPRRLAVGGDSAGGNLAAVTAIAARDAGGPPLAFQLLIYPTVAEPHETASARELAHGNYLLTYDLMKYFERCYVRGPEDYGDWRLSPLHAPDLSRLPPAFILTAGYDPLRDEGRAYADRLQAAGVPVRYRCYESMIHGFIMMGGVVDAANRALSECAQALAEAFAK
jgi:acetyl esterase